MKKKNAIKSVLVKNQKRSFSKNYLENGKNMKIIVNLRYDDECGNGHNTFTITAIIFEGIRHSQSGCCHEEIAKHFPELAKYIKWHLCCSDGPLHYVANTLYHAEQHAAKEGWVYFLEPITKKSINLEYCSIEKWNTKYSDQITKETKFGYSFEIDQKTEKKANFDFARLSAIWPEATDEELSQDQTKLKFFLLNRLPGLMEKFKKDMEELEFVF
jgi:hypothetical protein